LKEGYGTTPPAAGIRTALPAASVHPELNEYDSEALIRCIHPQPLARPTTPELYRHHFKLLRQALTQWMAGTIEPAGMPSYAAFSDGIRRVLDGIRANHLGQRVLLVSSGGPISTAVGQVLSTPPEVTIDLNMRIRNSALTEFALTPKRPVLLTFNGVPHLDGPAHRDWITHA
jgi:broad specificity phosphatase PhoE